ncbi:hypothetical protein [Saccharicrinis aurantiacus]|uniref:hypothetical protein n=1 Tax=Saccharicrinis aurantiacus TaxID=1849719 RepID=UPI00248FBB0E|nr:hypothetical protein [Saccharicrinis aurantiacus]
MEQHNCATCKLRAKYDKSPKSVIGRLWRWHISFCPGWKAYMNTLDDKQRAEIASQYSLIKKTNDH